MPPPHPPKYRPLADYLAALPAEVGAVTLTRRQLEALLGAPLPEHGRRRAFWATVAVRGGRAAKPRIAAGWLAHPRAGGAGLAAVTFTRRAADRTDEPLAPDGP